MNIEREIAWQGPCELLEARWTDKDGSTVKFRLLEIDEERRNPFVQFTKRRKGRAGTRFAATIVPVGMPDAVVYNDQVMLAGWNDAQQAGMSVTFWLAEDRIGHPFEGWSRKVEFMVVLVELDDDEQAIDQRMRAKVEGASKSPSQRLSYAAAMLCKNEAFWDWICDDQDGPIVMGEDMAAEWVRKKLGIQTRAQLDSDPGAAKAYRELVSGPFAEWAGQ